MNSVPKLFSCSYADCWTEKHFSTEFGVLTPNHTHSHTLFWGCVSRWFGRALAWHARGQRFDPAILHQKSTVLRRKYGAFLFVEAEGAALLCLQRFRPSYTPKKICCPGADRAKQSLGKLWGQHLSFMFMVRSGVGAEVLHPCVIPGGQQMVAVRLGVFGDQVAILVGQRLPEVQEGAAFFQCDG